MTAEPSITDLEGRMAGLLTIVRIGREWSWSWQRPDGQIEVGAGRTELDAARRAGDAIVNYYDKAH
jgi:hypothetical protein